MEGCVRRQVWWIRGLLCLTLLVPASYARAQWSTTTETKKPQPTGRVSVFSDTWSSVPDGAPGQQFGQMISSASLHAPDTEEDGFDYGFDLRHAGLNGGLRPDRLSMYEAYVGIRAGDGTLRAKAGHIWLSELGALGSLAGGLVEVRQAPGSHSGLGRFRLGAFAGLEPRVFDVGYYGGVKKYGIYGALDGENGRRHTVGYVTVLDRTLTERSVVAVNNFVPAKRVFFLYQALEYDLKPPAGQAQSGLNYFYSNARVNPTSRIELQGTYNRGRSIDTRGLADDVLNGRPISQVAIEGLAYESLGGRITVEPISRVRVYAGYSQDKSNRDDRPAGRVSLGGFAPNLGGSGLDLSASYSSIDRSNLKYHSEFVSLGRQIGRRVYVSGDYTTSLSFVRFVRSSDGFVIEDHPSTRRLSGTTSINIGGATSFQMTLDRTWDTGVREFRLLFGASYRF